MTKTAHFLKPAVLSLTGRGLKDKIDKVMNRHGSDGVSAVYCAVNTHILRR